VTPSAPFALPEERRRKEVLTPEGVPLAFRVASVGDRLAAVGIDLALQLVALAAAAVAAFLGSGAGGWVGAFFMLAFFLVRNFYFVYFETRWHGSTPGKRALGLRVIDASGGALTSEAVFARNLTREVEVFWPLFMLLAHQDPDEEVSWVTLPAVAWIFALALLPFFNRERRRLGDLIAGTLVVRIPREALREDLSSKRVQAAAGDIEFRPEQLDIYGIYELQVLEELLRRHDPAAHEAVARKIQRKIGWEGPAPSPREFLDAFYRAQRARLEHGLLLGQARERKRAKPR
jgi:uncharacterized RDD family membrane protein YckC